MEEWQPQRKEFEVDTPVPERAAVRLLNYPAWEVRVNGQVRAAESARGTEQLIVPLPAGKSLVEIRFVETPDRKIGAALSALAVILLAATAAMAKRKCGGPAN
jgi:hypothetical protein